MSLIKLTSTPDILNCIADLSNDEIFTSPKLANSILDTLPPKLWRDPNIKFLDPCSKTGVFLREIAKRLNNGLKNYIKNSKKRAEHIFLNQLYGISITQLTSLMSRRTLYYSKFSMGKNSICQKFNNNDGNVYYKSYSHIWKNNLCLSCGAKQNIYDRENREAYAYPFLHDKNIFNKMKFDVIIGNPPYQLEDGGFGKSASPVYHEFVEQAMRLNPSYLTMIIPARWYSGGKGLDKFRSKLLNDDRISQLHDFPETSDCFPGQNIRGGVCYFLWEKNYKGKTNVKNYKGGNLISETHRDLKTNGEDLFVRYNEGINILNKIKRFGEDNFDKLVSSRKPFGLPTNFESFKKESSSRFNIKLFRFGKNGYINENQTEINRDLIYKYKVIVPYSSPGGDEYPHSVLSTPLISKPNTCCTETYLVIGPFKNQKICENVISYMKTRIFRFLVLLLKNTQHVTRKNYIFVPTQNFNENWTDKKLYKKYNINNKEINFIESLVREMN
jgi:site-specific DNA-methyltransferase (adenine-specific)